MLCVNMFAMVCTVLWVMYGIAAVTSTAIHACCHFNAKTRVTECSNMHLTYIPAINQSTTVLLFDNNNLGKLTNDTFVNVSYPIRLESLNIKNNKIKSISQNAFSKLPYLKNLTLDKNPVPVHVLMSAFQSINMLKQLNNLNLNNMSLGQHRTIPENFFSNLEESKITHVRMWRNGFRTFNLSVFRVLQHLKEVDLSTNFISHIDLYSNTSIRNLRLNMNKLPFHCGNHIFIPNIKELFLQHNIIMRINKSTFKCLPNIETLDLSLNPIITIDSNAFAFLSNLYILSINSFSGLKVIRSSAFNNSNVKYIYFKDNKIFFNKPFSEQMFKGCNSLTHLDLSGNIMLKTSQRYFHSLLSPVRLTITNLNLAGTILRKFPKILLLFPNLTYLNLALNGLTYWKRENFPPKLNNLDLYNNEITSVNEKSLPENLTNFVINLAHNPFDCTCDLLWFLDLFTNPAFYNTFRTSSQQYICMSPPSYYERNLTDFAKRIGVQTCLLSSTISLIIISSLSFLFILIITGTAMYHYRWHLRYLGFLLRRGPMNKEKKMEKKNYDLFVSSSLDDVEWIGYHAIPRLENMEKIKLCIPDRDIQLGGVFADDIVRCLNASSKFLILLSNNFAKSEWCLFTLAVMHKQAMLQGNDCVVVKLGSINEQNMTPTIFSLLNTQRCMEWTDDQRVTELFWTQFIPLIKLQPVNSGRRMSV